MKNYEIIKEIINKSSEIITYSSLINQGITKYYITKLIKDNIIKQYSRGIYVKQNIFEDDFYILDLLRN